MRTMSVTIDDKLYERLKRTVPLRQVSKFVTKAIEEELTKTTNHLHEAYLEAAQDTDREKAIKEWENLDREFWS
jgi:metal-responsive CopG/Arc/MetJ family transcriptional regulator